MMTTLRIFQVSFIVCLMVAPAGPATASQPGEEEGPDGKTLEMTNEEGAAATTMRVFVDPETGEISSLPLDGLSAPLTKALSRSAEGLRVFELPNGGKGVHLDGRFQHALMVRMNPDGSFETVCTIHTHEAGEFLHGKATVAAPEPRDK